MHAHITTESNLPVSYLSSSWLFRQIQLQTHSYQNISRCPPLRKNRDSTSQYVAVFRQFSWNSWSKCVSWRVWLMPAMISWGWAFQCLCFFFSGLVQHKMGKRSSHLKNNWEFYIMSMKCEIMKLMSRTSPSFLLFQRFSRCYEALGDISQTSVCPSNFNPRHFIWWLLPSCLCLCSFSFIAVLFFG